MRKARLRDDSPMSPPPAGGFTLVELAIVVLIVGLLLTVILGVQQLRMHAAMVETIRDASAHSAATGAFLDRYGALPGDLPGAASKVPGCTGAGCEASPAASTTGDGNVGAVGRITRHQTGSASPAEDETALFWRHLALADLISGVSSAPSSPPAWGVTHPAAPVGGGFHVKDADGGITDRLPGWPPGAEQPSGTFLVLQPKVSGDLFPPAVNGQVLDASMAAAIDRKIDDNNPFDGAVVGYGNVAGMMSGAGCFRWTAIDRGRYAESDEGLNCGLAFRIGP